jgi:AraC family transcriptional regulator of adaptative response/methylated-DNA-[protein]-cysteine methyltransferase
MFGETKKPDLPLSLHVSGTNFQISVWKALLQIAPATVASYSQVATAIGHPGSARAVGLAVGANPVAFLIPCHRVIQQSGKLGGYHWGETRKQAIHAWESARYELPDPLLTFEKNTK